MFFELKIMEIKIKIHRNKKLFKKKIKKKIKNKKIYPFHKNRNNQFS